MPLPVSTTLLVGAALALAFGHLGGDVTALVLFVLAFINEAIRAAVMRSPRVSEVPVPGERQRTPIRYEDDDE